MQRGTRSDVVTNLANGRSVNAFIRVMEKDKSVEDNGDGTLTIRILATGNAVLYGSMARPVSTSGVPCDGLHASVFAATAATD